MNKLKTSIQLAWQSLRLNLLRTSLTVLGIIIGVASIIVVFSAGAALNELILGEIKSYGSDYLQVEARSPGSRSQMSLSDSESLKLADLEALLELDNVKDGYALNINQEKLSYANESRSRFVLGVSPSYIEIDNKTKLAEGYFFNEDDDKNQAFVVVLGSKLKEDLFADQNAIGRYISLGAKKFKVIGVLEEQGSAFSYLDFNESAYIPIKTLHNKVLGIDYAIQFIVQLEDMDKLEETITEMNLVLRERHKISDPSKDDFKITSMDEIIDTFNEVTKAITLLLTAIVLISLLVGGVGIMNIMYVSVSERTMEIGLRKAVGANKADITWQFLIESLLITFWGWLTGVLIGLGLSYVLSLIANSYGLNWVLVVPVGGIVLAFVFSLLSGLIFGWRPARQAAGLDPIEALRAEQ